MDLSALSQRILSFRPQSIGEMMGIDHLIPTVSIWESDPSSIPPAIMLSGPFGTGKTTLARIIASMAGAKGSDIKEVNAGDDRKIDDVRSLIEQTRYQPLSGKRVFIIDEFHGYISHAQTALLKPIEEPPKGSMFILVTSDPIKVLPQIRSRCVKLETKPLPREATRTLIRLASGGELNVSQEVALAIWQLSMGHTRDLLKLVARYLPQLLQGEVPDEIAKTDVVDWNDLIYKIVQSPGLARPEHLRALNRPEISPYELSILDDSLDRALSTFPEKMMGVWPKILEFRIHARSHLLYPKEYATGVMCLLLSHLEK